MTTIKLRTSDQHLIVTNRVKLAKGDINSVDLRVYLDSAWDEFPYIAVTATNDAVNNVPSVDFALEPNYGAVYYEGGIPSIILSKAGTLSISISGVSLDGTKKKTSTIVKLKVYESLVNAETTIEPDLDLYMQYLAALKEEINPTTEYMNRVLEKNAASVAAMIEENKAEITAMIEEQQNWMNGDLLWENPDPTDEMETLTINLDRTPYTRLHVLVKESNPEHKGCVVVHDNGRYRMSIVSSSAARYIIVTDNTITIAENSHGGTGNIPYKIIGYKY